MDINKLKEAEDFYNDRIIGWMLNDLKKSISVGTNFLTALGCLVYTEIIGTFLPPLKAEKGSPREKNFYRCFYRLPSGTFLKKIDKYIIEETNKNIYQQMRHNMAHAYYPSVKKHDNGIFQFITSVVARDGYKISEKGKERSAPIFFDDQNRLALATRNYVLELSSAVNEFKKQSFKLHNIEFQKASINGIDKIHRGI